MGLKVKISWRQTSESVGFKGQNFLALKIQINWSQFTKIRIGWDQRAALFGLEVRRGRVKGQKWLELRVRVGCGVGYGGDL